MHFKAVESVGKKVVFIKDNKVVGTGVTQTSTQGWVSASVKDGELYDQLVETPTGAAIKPSWIMPRFSEYTGGFLDSGMSEALDIETLFEDVRIVDEFNLLYGMVPETFKDVPQYRFRDRERDGYSLGERPMVPYFREHLGLWKDQVARLDLSQKEHSPAGEFLGRLHYKSHIIDQFLLDSQGETLAIGSPSTGGQHVLIIRANHAVHILEFIKNVKAFKVPEHREEGKALFIEELERKLYEQVF